MTLSVVLPVPAPPQAASRERERGGERARKEARARDRERQPRKINDTQLASVWQKQSCLERLLKNMRVSITTLGVNNGRVKFKIYRQKIYNP